MKMASPVDEQSDGHFDVPQETLGQEVDQSLLSILVHDPSFMDVKQDSDSQNLSDDAQSVASELLPHGVDLEVPSDGSAFHIISHTDSNKDWIMTAQLNSESQNFKQLEIASFEYEDKTPATGQSIEDSAKHFSDVSLEHHTAELGSLNKNTEGDSQHMLPSASGAADEDMLLGITEGVADVDGMDIDNIEVTDKSLYVPNNSDSLDTPKLEDVKASQISDSKAGTDFQFLKPATIENSSKESSVAGACLDNDVENELKKQHALPVHKPEEVFDIDEETRMGLDQAPVDPVMSEASFIYPTLPPKKLFQLDDTKDSEASDTETKMSAACDTEDIRLRNTISVDDATKDSVASDSNTETTTPSRKQRRASREGLGISLMEGIESGERMFSPESLFEYQWPQDGGEWHMLQEQISEYLKIKSFKRKYPDLYRRTCDKEEKDFLREKGVVTETQSDLGLTALRSEEVYDLMMKDYNDKYKEYISHLQEKQKKVIREKHKEYSAQAKLDKSKIDAYSKKAARSAAEFNASLMKDKKEERKAYFDLQTYTIHYPKYKFRTLAPEYTKTGAYPVALFAGQYQDNYKRLNSGPELTDDETVAIIDFEYSPEELRYYPLKTSLKDPPKIVKNIRPPPPGAKLPTPDKQKVIADSGGEESGSSSGEDNDDDNDNVVSTENENKENETAQIEKQEFLSPVRLEKKVKGAPRRKSGKTADRLKKGGRKNKDAEVDRSDEKTNQEGDERGIVPEEKKMPGKIHGLEKCRICKKRSTKEERQNDKLVKCAECGKIGHMGCLDLTEELVAVIKTYPWQCMECKTCVECLDPYDEDKMMFCDRCDRGYHTFCIGLDALPTGHWECKSCEGSLKLLERSKSKKLMKSYSVETTPSSKIEQEVSGEEIVVKCEDDQGVVADDLQEEEQQVSSVGDEKEDAGSERDGTASSEAGTPVSHEGRGRKRRHAVITPKVKAKTARAKSVKQERTQAARQSKRLKIKEEEEEEKRKKDEDKEPKKRKKKNKKAEEEPRREGPDKDEVMDETEDNGEKAEGGILKKEAAPDDFREVVSEGVDDSFVNMFDKNDEEERDMELTHSVTEEAGAGPDVSEECGMNALAVKMEEVPIQTSMTLNSDKSREACMKVDSSENFDTKSTDENKSLSFPYTASAFRNDSSDHAASPVVSSEVETVPSSSDPGTTECYQASSYSEPAISDSGEGWQTQMLVQQTHPQLLAEPEAPPLPSGTLSEQQMLPESASQTPLPHMHPQSGGSVQETPLLGSTLPPVSESSHSHAVETDSGTPSEMPAQSRYPQSAAASACQDLAVLNENSQPQQLGLEPVQSSSVNTVADITDLSFCHGEPSADRSMTDSEVVQGLLAGEEQTNSTLSDEFITQP